jgi:uncharacterized membrane protein
MAFAMTLLVVGIDVPDRERFPEQELVRFLIGIGHSVVVYGACFWRLGTYWYIHSTIVSFLRQGNRPFVRLNLLFLLPVTFVPFAAKLKDAYRASRLAVLLLGGVNIFISACLAVLWLYATSHPELLQRPVSAAARRSMLGRITISPITLGLLAIAASVIHVYLTTLLLLTIPLYHLTHRRIDEEASGIRADGE